MDDPGRMEDDVARLRRRAFSREGTPDDLRRLAALEAPAAVQVAPIVEAPVREEVPVDEPQQEPPVERRSPRPVAVAALGGLVVGALATWLLTGLVESSTSTDDITALVVFDRAPTDVDDPAALSIPLDQIVPPYLDDLDLRRLGEGLGWRAYALRGDTFRMTQICLIVDTGSTVASACASSDDFAERGLVLGTGTGTFRWGPQGTELWIEARGV